VGDQQHQWSQICRGIPNLRRGANSHGLQSQLDDLLTGTRQGTVRPEAWSALKADIDARDGIVADYTGKARDRNGDLDDDDDDAFLMSLSTGTYRCPGGLCDQAAPTAPSVTPRCWLLGVDMSGG
jgi:hypothetical protein